MQTLPVMTPVQSDQRTFEMVVTAAARNLPTVLIVCPDSCHCGQPQNCITLDKWLAQANSEDLHALYTGDISNQTYYQLHDLMFSLFYKDETARYFKTGILHNFKALIDGTTTIKEIRETAALMKREPKLPRE